MTARIGVRTAVGAVSRVHLYGDDPDATLCGLPAWRVVALPYRLVALDHDDRCPTCWRMARLLIARMGPTRKGR